MPRLGAFVVCREDAIPLPVCVAAVITPSISDYHAVQEQVHMAAVVTGSVCNVLS